MQSQEKLYTYALSVLRDPEMAMDVVQDTFHTAAERIEKLADHENPTGWLMNTLKHKIHDQQRSLSRYAAHFVSLSGYEFAAVDEKTKGFPEDNKLLARRMLSDIQKFLKPEDYYLLKRVAFDKASHREAAKELGITVWASQKRLERIRKELETLFPEHKHEKTKHKQENKKKKNFRNPVSFSVLRQYIVEGGNCAMAENSANNPYAFLENLSTEELQALLRDDLNKDSENQELVDHILEVIIKRNNKTQEERTADTRRAWKDFQENYCTPEGEGKSLYPIFPNEEAVCVSSKHKKVLRWVSAAAVLTLLVGAMILPVFGSESIFSILGRWTEEVFYFVRYGTPPEETTTLSGAYYSDNAELMALWDALVENGVESPAIPTWIPEEYRLVKVENSKDRLGCDYFNVVFRKESNVMFLQINASVCGSEGTLFHEKDTELVDKYSSNNVDFYILHNNERIACAWAVDDYEYILSGQYTEDILYKIIDSIHGEV